MVASYTQLLGKRYKGRLDADADDFISYAVEGTLRMQQLIQDLLAYSQVVRQSEHVAPVDFEAVVTSALANLRSAIGEHQAVVTQDPLPTISGDERLLVQLFQNLLGNAIKFRGEAPPKIHILAQRKETEWMFGVRDNGIGLDPQYAGQIFVLFQRLHTRDDYPGNGIGLTLCKKIVERHGGRIWVDSQLGHGSTFYFTLPGDKTLA
jgi:light-regulated signal transduction histidine kinase (bacteriophytochrome)